MENGIAKLRINPGNIGGADRVRRVADCAKAHRVPIRIGVNSGSAEKELLEKYGGPTPECLVESALGHARLLEKAGYEEIVLSMKSSDVRQTVEAYRLAHQRCDYPLHVGVTEAGLPGQGTVKSAIGIGSLLLDGIGDTIRVSLSGDPVPEAKAGWDILRALNLRTRGVQLIACPTCGRTGIPVAEIAADLNARGRAVVFLGDGVPVYKEALAELMEVPYSFAPAHLARQRAAAVYIRAAAVADGIAAGDFAGP
jgi:(E)-4-hydroxy-3-methylbut-2-enyl-diphosphate synthase